MAPSIFSQFAYSANRTGGSASFEDVPSIEGVAPRHEIVATSDQPSAVQSPSLVEPDETNATSDQQSVRKRRLPAGSSGSSRAFAETSATVLSLSLASASTFVASLSRRRYKGMELLESLAGVDWSESDAASTGLEASGGERHFPFAEYD